MNHTSTSLDRFLSSVIAQVTLFLISGFYLQDPEKFQCSGFSRLFLSYLTSCIDDLIACRFKRDEVILFLILQEFVKLLYSTLTFVIAPASETLNHNFTDAINTFH